MKPCIAIPSYNRPNAMALHRVKDVGLKVFVFVRREQLDMYSQWSKDYTLVPIDGVSELGMTRRVAVEYLFNLGYKWVFMLDDDISKVEMLGEGEKGWNSRRVLSGSPTPPRMEKEAFQLWYKIARKHDLALSSPNHRAYDRFNHGSHVRVNKSAIIQCVLLQVDKVVLVGNYKNTRKTGAEDYYLQYMLMKNGFNTGKIGLVEYDCPTIGNISDGTKDTMIDKYNRFIRSFKKNVCDDESLVTTKTTKTGVPSLQFVWKNWGGYTIPIKRKDD